MGDKLMGTEVTRSQNIRLPCGKVLISLLCFLIENYQDIRWVDNTGNSCRIVADDLSLNHRRDTGIDNIRTCIRFNVRIMPQPHDTLVEASMRLVYRSIWSKKTADVELGNRIFDNLLGTLSAGTDGFLGKSDIPRVLQ